MSKAKLVGVNVSENQAAMVDEAAKAYIEAGHGKTKADFLRNGLGRVCAAMLGKDWPADEVLEGPKDAIAIAAEKYGLTRAQFTKFAALSAAGVPQEEALAKAKKVGAKAAEAPATTEAPATA